MKNDRSVFLTLLEQFFTSYLPTSLGASANTIRSYKYAFRLLLEYLYKEKQIQADNITFSELNYETISSFLNWLEAERNCSVSTRNQRHAALMSFSEYAQNRNFDAAAVFRSSLLKIPVKKKEDMSPSTTVNLSNKESSKPSIKALWLTRSSRRFRYSNMAFAFSSEV